MQTWSEVVDGLPKMNWLKLHNIGRAEQTLLAQGAIAFPPVHEIPRPFICLYVLF